MILAETATGGSRAVFGEPGLGDAAPHTRTVADVDLDGIDDLWAEYRVTDLGALSSSATLVGLHGYATDGTEVLATFDIGRLTSPNDADADGIHNTCDLCDDTPPGAARGPDGCPWP
jgi:hypothetical protein